jgi:hypothetical protein
MSELHVRNIANDLQTIEGIHLSGMSWDKIRQGVQGAIEVDRETLLFEKETFEKAYKNQINTSFLLNELKLWIRENKNASRNDILQVILQQEMKGVKADLRNIKVK